MTEVNHGTCRQSNLPYTGFGSRNHRHIKWLGLSELWEMSFNKPPVVDAVALPSTRHRRLLRRLQGAPKNKALGRGSLGSAAAGHQAICMSQQKAISKQTL
jgi:hypothetical protein